MKAAYTAYVIRAPVAINEEAEAAYNIQDKDDDFVGDVKEIAPGDVAPEEGKFEVTEEHCIYTHKLQEVLQMKDGPLQRESLLKLFEDFEVAAKHGARTVVDELGSTTKTIAAMNLGGVAGGTKYMHGGILFKLATDPSMSDGYLYGGNQPSALFAGKAAANELKASNTLFRMFFDKSVDITLPLQILLDYKGYRVVAMSVLPLGRGAKFIYGSSNGGKTVHNSDPKFNAMIKDAAEELHLAEHMVKQVPLCMAGDVEGHMDAQGKYYLLDLARMWPPESTHFQPPDDVNDRAIFYRLLRPEFLKKWKSLGEPPLSPDALSGWGMRDRAKHNSNVMAATEYLIKKHIPAFVVKLEESAAKDSVVVPDLLACVQLSMDQRCIDRLLQWLSPLQKELVCPLTHILPLLPWFFKQNGVKEGNTICAQFEKEAVWAKEYGKFLPSLDIANTLHHQGISLRHMQHLREHFQNDALRDKFFLEMVRRSVKTMVRCQLAQGKTAEDVKQFLETMVKPKEELLQRLKKQIQEKFLLEASLPDLDHCLGNHFQDISTYVLQTCGLEVRSKPNTFIMLVNAKTQYDRAIAERERDRNRNAVMARLAEAFSLCKQILQSDPDDSEAKELGKRCGMLLSLKHVATSNVIDAVRTAQSSKSNLEYFFNKLTSLGPQLLAEMEHVELNGDDRMSDAGLVMAAPAERNPDADLVGLFRAVVDDELKCLIFAAYLDNQVGKNFFAGAMQGGREGAGAEEALRMACRGGRGDCVRMLLALKADPNSRDEEETSVLAAAAFEGHATTVQILVDAGAVVKGSGALDAAASNGHAATTELLLQHPDVKDGDSEGLKEEALTSAAKNGHAAVIKTLIRAKANVEAVMAKVQNSHMQQVLEDARQEEGHGSSGGAVCVEDDTLVFAWGTALREGSLTAANLLISANASPDFLLDDEPILMRALTNNDFAIVQALINSKANTNVRYRGKTPLQWAAGEGKVDILTMLLQGGANVNDLDDSKMSSALSYAARWGHQTIIQILLEFKADPNKGERSALMWCAEWGRIPAAKLLIDGKANVGHVSAERTAVSWAVRWRQPTFLKFLLDMRADPTQGEPPGSLVSWIVSNCKSPFSKAIEQLAAAQPGFDPKLGDTAVQIVELLLSHKATLQKDCLRTAASMKRTDIVRLLLRAGAAPDVGSLTLAITERCADIVESLMEARANVNQTNDEGVKPLLSAIRADDTRVVLLLLEAKADINLIDTAKATEITSGISPQMKEVLKPYRVFV